MQTSAALLPASRSFLRRARAALARRSPPRAAQPWLWRLLLLLVTLALLILPVAFAVRFSAQSGWWWESGFRRYDADRRTGLTLDEVNAKGAELREYFESDAAIVRIAGTDASGAPGAFFSEREALHLVDVKRLLERTYDAGWAALGFLIAFVAVLFWRRGRAARVPLARAAVTAGLGVGAIILVLGLVAVSGFDEAFRQFHLLFFTNDLWQLSSRDRLIQMFPQGFFFDTTMLIGASTLLLAALSALGGWLYLRRAGLPLVAFGGEPRHPRPPSLL